MGRLLLALESLCKSSFVVVFSLRSGQADDQHGFTVAKLMTAPHFFHGNFGNN
jgi:hypothetical protein